MILKPKPLSCKCKVEIRMTTINSIFFKNLLQNSCQLSVLSTNQGLLPFTLSIRQNHISLLP
jgi:hypothetical protein